ncbi:hypothetical protein MTP99_018764 [Tenebrio molitor]|nr:hypothetical protein MTP99_018764 [Tenebrio molitor]
MLPQMRSLLLKGSFGTSLGPLLGSLLSLSCFAGRIHLQEKLLGVFSFLSRLFFALSNRTSARRGHERTLRLFRSQQRPQRQQNRRVNPLRTTPRGSGLIVPYEFRTFQNRASILFASRCGLSPSFEAAVP